MLLGSICLLGWGHPALNFAPFAKPVRAVAPPDTVKKAKAVDVEVDEENIPDSLLHPRWKVQRTTPITYDDLKENSIDLIRPENMQQTVEYNDSLDRYIIGNKRIFHYPQCEETHLRIVTIEKKFKSIYISGNHSRDNMTLIFHKQLVQYCRFYCLILPNISIPY